MGEASKNARLENLNDKSLVSPQVWWLALLLHTAAAAVCFAVNALVPICLVLLVVWYDGDPGGPMFLPVFILAMLVFGLISTLFVMASTLLHHLVRKRYQTPYWVPLLAILGIVTTAIRLLFGTEIWPYPLLIGSLITMEFFCYERATDTQWRIASLFHRVLLTFLPANVFGEHETV